MLEQVGMKLRQHHPKIVITFIIFRTLAFLP
jgi:hypothetical protein